jgi:hypothetical protein
MGVAVRGRDNADMQSTEYNAYTWMTYSQSERLDLTKDDPIRQTEAMVLYV